MFFIMFFIIQLSIFWRVVKETNEQAFPKLAIFVALRDLVTFVQFKKREKHPWRSVDLLKLTLLHGCFSRFLSRTNGTKSRKASHI